MATYLDCRDLSHVNEHNFVFIDLLTYHVQYIVGGEVGALAHIVWWTVEGRSGGYRARHRVVVEVVVVAVSVNGRVVEKVVGRYG